MQCNAMQIQKKKPIGEAEDRKQNFQEHHRIAQHIRPVLIPPPHTNFMNVHNKPETLST